MLKVSPIVELHDLDDYFGLCTTYNISKEESLNQHRAYSANKNEELEPCLLKNVLENYQEAERQREDRLGVVRKSGIGVVL